MNRKAGEPSKLLWASVLLYFAQHQVTANINLIRYRVAELGSLSSGAKIAMKIFVKHVFTIFATNAAFLRIIANLQIQLS